MGRPHNTSLYNEMMYENIFSVGKKHYLNKDNVINPFNLDIPALDSWEDERLQEFYTLMNQSYF